MPGDWCPSNEGRTQLFEGIKEEENCEEGKNARCNEKKGSTPSNPGSRVDAMGSSRGRSLHGIGRFWKFNQQEAFVIGRSSPIPVFSPCSLRRRDQQVKH